MYFIGSSFSSSSPSSRLSALARLSDRHSCLAAPYAPTDPRTARYFEVVISKADAPVVCGFAGKLKGKAIYADCDLPKNTRIWTEAPFLGMQHELNKRLVPCCQYCFVPLIADYQARWSTMAARWNDALRLAPDDPRAAHAHDLDEALERLHVQRRHCGLVGAAARCVCGDLYCSKLCQIRAYHEFHAVLCPRDDPFSAMSEFVRHTQETNDIFLLAAKVIARVLCRFLVSRDLIKAREPMDMFYKKPWWEVVMMERQVQQQQQQRQARGVDDASGGGSNSHSSYSSGSGSSPDTDDATARTNDRTNNGFDDGAATDASHSPASSASGESQCLKDLLMSTHQLLADALECNLVHLEREDQLHGFTVDEIWTSCASVLSFEFFAAQLGLFEMNNIRVESITRFKRSWRCSRTMAATLIRRRGILSATTMTMNDGANANATVLTILTDTDTTWRCQRCRVAVDSDVRAVAEDRETMSSAFVLSGIRGRRVYHAAARSAGSRRPAAVDRRGAAASMQLRRVSLRRRHSAVPIVCTMNHSCDPNCTGALHQKRRRACRCGARISRAAKSFASATSTWTRTSTSEKPVFENTSSAASVDGARPSAAPILHAVATASSRRRRRRL
ncbi:hypothetical protein PINS_up023314 [Pythium insidiosum]|nr:hypothetical protein PINS_up023314 [Pythium insidiosum]